MMHSSNRPPLDAILAVLTTVEMGSFTAAAGRLNLTHGAISRRVSAVEKWAGIRLFDRHGRGVKLNPQANELVAQLETAIAIIDDGPRHARKESAMEILRISLVPSFARLFLLPNIARIEGNPQDVCIEVDLSQRLQSLSSARLAIRHGSGNWSGVRSSPLFPETLYPVAMSAVADDLRDNPAPRRILSYPLIIDMPDANWKTWFAASDINYNPRPIDRSYADYDLALMAAAAGRGIALLRSPFGADLAARLGLRPVSMVQVPSATQFFIVSQIGSRTSTIDKVCARIARCCHDLEQSKAPSGRQARDPTAESDKDGQHLL